MPVAPVRAGMYDTILVATDGSDHARQAAAHAEYLAGVFDASLSLLTVVDPASAAGPFSAGGVDEAYRERLRDAGRETVAEAAAAVGRPTETAVRLGGPTESILAYADDNDVDLIVAGTRGRTGLRRHLLGSVAERLVALADVPVVTAQSSDDGAVDPYDEILVATDGSAAAEAATDHALAVADRAGARVHALAVVGAGTAEADIDLPEETRSELAATAEEAAQWVGSRARADGLDAVESVVEGSPAEAIVEYTADHDVDLVAVGTTGRTSLTEVLLGNTTDSVLRRADAPVLTAGVSPTE